MGAKGLKMVSHRKEKNVTPNGDLILFKIKWNFVMIQIKY